MPLRGRLRHVMSERRINAIIDGFRKDPTVNNPHIKLRKIAKSSSLVSRDQGSPRCSRSGAPWIYLAEDFSVLVSISVSKIGQAKGANSHSPMWPLLLY